ncbi:MAG TPA: ATP-dependent helicase HrpB [Acidimicrobiia bacterium]|nr:ATP-dependent helicase HrpB [Acidimicrobiia bacterium]
MIAPTGLPVEESIAALRAALAEDGQAVLQAPPGAGKTTVVPLRLLDEPWLAGGRIVMLEPRRLATRAAARRMAALVGEDVGRTIGYRTRDERRSSPATRIEVVTEGILTRRLQQDPALPGTALVIFDEFHERNLHADLALALTLDARAALRPDLRLLVMSATLDTGRIAALLGSVASSAPVIVSEGRAWPVEIRWVPPAPPARKAGFKGRPGPPPRAGSQVVPAVTAAVLRALREETGDVLVFLPGAGDIRRVEAALRDPGSGLPDGVDIRPLYGALSIADQDAALAPSPPGRRRVVLSTDIAETSLTVDGVRVVIDSGWHRTPRYDARSGLTRLETVGITKASADQRAGRAGRTEPGVAYRLWSKMEHAARRPFAAAEITTADLSGLALELAVWGGNAATLPFLDPPPTRSLEEGRRLLRFLGALDTEGRPTDIGRRMAELPLHPRLARMVTGAAGGGDELTVAAVLFSGRGGTACALAALLEDRDVLRGRPDEVDVDMAVRLRLLIDRDARHPQADGPSVAAARRRATELARRVGIDDLAGPAEDPDAGAVLALAYPDRIGQARGGARFRMRGGGGAWLPADDPLAGEAFLVIAELDAAGRGSAGTAKDSRIRLAAALDATDIEAVAATTGATVDRVATLSWDPARDDLRARVERRFDNLVLGESEGPAEPGPATAAALLARVRATKLGILNWTDAARSLQARTAFARRAGASENAPAWPDLSDDALLASADDWLVPLLSSAVGRSDLEAIDMATVLRRQLGHRLAELDRVAPGAISFAGGRQVPVTYGDQPAAEVRVQDAFGTTTHPTVGGVPVVLSLLSPAGRPIQVTADLPGFWNGSWADVRKDMAGRYPKHSWPPDPATASPPRRTPGRPG